MGWETENGSPNGAEFATGQTDRQNYKTCPVLCSAVQCWNSRCFMTIALAAAVAAVNLKKGLELDGMMGLEF